MILRKDVADLSLPIIAEQAFLMIMGMINAIMAGRLGKEAVSAIGMVDSVNNIFIAFFSALAVGGTVVVAQYMGRNDHKQANEAVRHAVFSGLALSGGITLVLLVFRHGLVALLFGAAEEAVLVNTTTYLGITLLTYPLIALNSVASGVLRGAGDTKTPMKITIFMNILNVVFSYFLIYGIDIGPAGGPKLSFPGLGVKGAALGIAVARTAGAALAVFVLLNGSRSIRLIVDRYFRPDLDMLRSIFGVGIPASIESLLFNTGKLITQVFIVEMGTAAIAANYIAWSLFGLINIPGSALSIAATTLVGMSMGRGEDRQAKATIIYLTKIGTICLFAICAAAFPFSGLLVSIYTPNRDVVGIASSLFLSTLIAMPPIWALSFIIPSGLKGAGDAKYTLFVSIIGMWAFRVGMGYLLGIPLKMGILGFWIGMYLDWVVRSVLFIVRLKGDRWKKNVVIRPSLPT